MRTPGNSHRPGRVNGGGEDAYFSSRNDDGTDVMVDTSPALACPSNGSGCKDCILDQMKYSCPSCVPLIRCMARCLWGGTSSSNCINRCDCNGGKPRLSDCRKCMSRCKCSCVV
ncbi:uncharacterized protein LOC111280265 [Durio zibethinus]|uniref:Uncharacterized protein LOC111280265 n=1 Tax=Durio zibethinus TaxID=66656 RepID=A0A6P5X489_DURZI|nr:uncharacterized protein LOC111280265 [Durio zibethinus]